MDSVGEIMDAGGATEMVGRLRAVWLGSLGTIAATWLALLVRVGRRAAVSTLASAIVLVLGAAYLTFAEHAWHQMRALRASRHGGSWQARKGGRQGVDSCDSPSAELTVA